MAEREPFKANFIKHRDMAIEIANRTYESFNPYLEIFNAMHQELGIRNTVHYQAALEMSVDEMVDWMTRRGVLTMIRYDVINKHSFAFPTEDVFKAIEKHIGKRTLIVDIGAGTGYWSWMLHKRGFPMFAVDNGNYKDWKKEWFPVYRGTHEIIRGIEYCVPLLVWPENDKLMKSVYDIFQGEFIMVVREPSAGWDPRFDEWTLVADVEIPQWPDMRDWFGIWKKERI